MKKIAAFLLILCVVSTACIGSLAWLSLKSEALEAVSFSVSDITLYEGIDSEIAEDLGGGEYNKYSLNFGRGDLMYLELSDGREIRSELAISGIGAGNEKEYYLRTDMDRLQEEAHWQAGQSYLVTAEIVEKSHGDLTSSTSSESSSEQESTWIETVFVSDTFSVTVEENPVAGLAISDMTLYEGLDKAVLTDGDFDQINNRYLNSENCSIQLKSGMYCSPSSIFIEGRNARIEYFPAVNPQETPWVAGNVYDVTAKLMMATDDFSIYKQASETTFRIEVLENPIDSIEIADLTVYEDLDTIQVPDSQGALVSRYAVSPVVVASFKDGYRESFTDSVSFAGNSYQFETNALELQSDDPWTVGNTYTVTGTVAGFSDTFEVTVLENPVASLEVFDITLYEGIDSYLDTNWETGEKYQYYPMDIGVEGIVTLKDGTQMRTADFDNGAIEVVPGKRMAIQIDSLASQSQYTQHWMPGYTYEVMATFAGVSAPLDIIIRENPFVDLEVADMTLYEGLDGFWDYSSYPQGDRFWYVPSPRKFTVTLRDGTKKQSNAQGEIWYNGQVYYLNDISTASQYDQPWAPGETHEATANFAGLEYTFRVTIAEGFSGLSVVGDKQPVLLFTRENGEVVKERVLKFDVVYATGNGRYGTLYTERHTLDAAWESDESGAGYRLTTAHLTSDLITDCSFLKSGDRLTTDLDNDFAVTSDDAIYLLGHLEDPQKYPVLSEQDCDFNGDGKVDADDVIYLLYNSFLPDKYLI